MTEHHPIEVDIYKTTRRAETFLFVPAGAAPDGWPDGLAETFQPAEHVMTLTLTEQQPLAAQPASEVMTAIVERGYFLQLPPGPMSMVSPEESAEC